MGALASAYPEKKWDSRLSSMMYESLARELKGVRLTDFNYRYNSGEKVAKLFDSVAQSLKTSI